MIVKLSTCTCMYIVYTKSGREIPLGGCCGEVGATCFHHADKAKKLSRYTGTYIHVYNYVELCVDSCAGCCLQMGFVHVLFCVLTS